MKKEIRIFNLNALELDGQEIKLFLFYLWHRDNKNKVNRDYASAKKASDALGVTTRTVFRLLEKLHERKWIERVEGEVYINPNMGMSLMIDATNLGIQPKTEARGDKEYLNNPDIRKAFKQMFPDKKVDQILDSLYATYEKPVRNWHEFAKACIAKSDLTKPKIRRSNGYLED